MDSDDDGRGGKRFGDLDSDDVRSGGATLAARRASFFGFVPALRGPLPLGPDPIDGSAGGSAGAGFLGRGAVARCLAAAPFAAGEGGGALLAVAHQRSADVHVAGDDENVVATVDILILPQEPSPGWARHRATATNTSGDAFEDAPPFFLIPGVDDDDEGALPPLLAVDRVRLCSTHRRRPGPSNPLGSRGGSAACDELASFVTAVFDPGCRERVFCCAGGAAHAVTLTWLSRVEGAVDDDDDTEELERANAGTFSNQEKEKLPLPTVATLFDTEHALLGIAPVGDPLAEGLVISVDVAGNAKGSYPPPPLPPGAEDDEISAAAASEARVSLTAASEASAELNALAEGPAGGSTGGFGSGAVVPVGSGCDLRLGAVDANAALAKAATALKEKHLKFAHRVHAACRRHGVRLGVEVRRQMHEAERIREGLVSVAARRETLERRLERARIAHEDVRERLRKLAAVEKKIPRPATSAERAFRVTLRAVEDDAPLLRAKLEELRRRAEEAYAASPDAPERKAERSGGRTETEERLVLAEIAAQERAMSANLSRARRLESRGGGPSRDTRV